MKKHGDQWELAARDPVNRALYRFTLDFRIVNTFTKTDAFPLPRIIDLLNHMHGSGRFSVQDIPDAFHSVKIRGMDGNITAFGLQNPNGHYEYLVMPMGFKNAPAVWCRIMEMVFNGIPLTEIVKYLDDICNHVDDFIGHVITQRKMYLALEEHNITVKPSKSHLNMKKVKLLGNIMSKEGRRPDPNLIKAIMDLDRPFTLPQVLSLSGLVNVARDYIPALATIMQPIYALRIKGIDIAKAWEDNVHGKALQAIKIILTTEPVLQLPDNTKEYYVEVDACRIGRGFGAILFQKDINNNLHPVAYWSRSLLAAERNYSATNLECTALHDCLMHWSSYLINFKNFHVTTDHYALVYMVTRPKGDPMGRLARMCIALQLFGSYLHIYHRAGT